MENVLVVCFWGRKISIWATIFFNPVTRYGRRTALLSELDFRWRSPLIGKSMTNAAVYIVVHPKLHQIDPSRMQSISAELLSAKCSAYVHRGACAGRCAL